MLKKAHFGISEKEQERQGPPAPSPHCDAPVVPDRSVADAFIVAHHIQ